MLFEAEGKVLVIEVEIEVEAGAGGVQKATPLLELEGGPCITEIPPVPVPVLDPVPVPVPVPVAVDVLGKLNDPTPIPI